MPDPCKSPHGHWRTSTMLVAYLLGIVPAAGAQTLDRWLVLGPVPALSPAFSSAADSALLESGSVRLRQSWPAAGEVVQWLGGRELRWEPRSTTRDGTLSFAAHGSGAEIAYAATYVQSDRRQRARLTVGGSGHRSVWLDGRRVTGDSVTLDRGKHLLLVEALRPARERGAWRISARLETQGRQSPIAVSVDPRHPPTWTELRSIPTVRDIQVDPTGQRVAWVRRSLDEENDRWVSHVEVRELAEGRLLAELRPAGDAFAPRWSRDGRRLAFTAPTDREGGKGSDLWVWETEQSGARRVLRAEAGLGDVQWSADGAWVYFTVTVRADTSSAPKPGQAERLTEVWERWSFWPDKAELHALHLEQGTRLKLAGGADHSVVAPTLSNDGTRMVFNRDVRTAERPFLRSEVWLLDLGNLEPRKLIDLKREIFFGPSRFAWSPDDRAVAFCASAEELLQQDDPAFSVYETELYAVPLDRPQLRHLSAGFTPSVGSGLSCPDVHWSREDGRIYVAADVGGRTLPARTTTAVTAATDQATLETMPLDAELMGEHDFAAGWLVAEVESPTTAPAVQRMRLGDGAASTLLRHADDRLAKVVLPAWKPWSFRDSEGWQIEAWYWLPPDFDAARRYPMIVHYYGGTLSMKKEFEERLLWYAAQGYVVLMMNPAGAPGYGQEFSNLHINDWGYPAATDIIEGVTQFLREHPFVDAKRIGNFGHSYGGFMTMHLLTRTDLFAAAAQIAGISNIAGYWGAGWTGYSYTEGTCRGCYPWNRPDVFVERSPLFQADRIRAPLLLVHGTGDTNVVPTESEQMFTALRMLGREAELVRFHGENHGIDSRPSVSQTLDAVMLEWFDKHLRDQPEAWANRWNATPSGPAAATRSSPR